MEVYFYQQDNDFQLEEKEETNIRQWMVDTIHNEIAISEGEISVIFCSDEYLIDINMRYLEHDYYTDIITFSYNESPIVADLYISIDRVNENANKLEIPFSNELYRVIIHGVLHLCGYDDQNEFDQKKIRAMEDKYLGELSV